MEAVHLLAEAYFITKAKRDEQRRKIDVDCAAALRVLEKDRSTEGKIKLLNLKGQIQTEETRFRKLRQQTQQLEEALLPFLQKIKASGIAPLLTQIKEETIATYINNEGELEAKNIER